MKINLKKALVALFMASIGLVGSTTTLHASVKSFQKDANSVRFTLDKGLLNIKICKADIIRVSYTTLNDLPIKESLVVSNTWNEKIKFNVKETATEINIITDQLIVSILKSDQSIRYYSLDKKLILSEKSGGTQMEASTVAGLQTNTCKTTFLSSTDEGLYGLGCHPEDTLSINYKGRDQVLAIKYLTGAIPFLVSTHGYGLLWDNYSPSYFYGAENNNTQYSYVSENGLMVDYYFFYGPSLDKVIANYRVTTGQAPMFGKWAFGLFQSQDRYKSQAEVLSVKDNYRNNKIPVDCIVQDWFYWEPNVIGSHDMCIDRYPNPKQMVDELHKANIHAMISIWPVMAKGTRNYEAMEKAGNLTDITWQNVMTFTYDNYYDAHSEKARQMYWKQANDSLISRHGWDAWWVDQCEPDNGTLLDDRRRTTFATGRGIDFFNTYSLAHTSGLYKNWRNEIPNKRAFFLARQAFAGQQRNAATLWSSDITCTFKAFKSQVPQGINACASGYPYWTSDIGGYHFNWSAPDWSTPLNKELFTRWFQFGTFCPIFRIHGKGERAIFSKNWDENMRATLIKYDNLRYRLLPYIYSLSHKVTADGYTMMRNLAFDFADDKTIQNIPDQYMFGPAFLVNPITDPGLTSRNVYLPKATWYDFWTGKKLEGGQSINASAPIETMPLYVRAGSIIPMGPYLQYATEKQADNIELRIYRGANGEFTLYEDENETYNYEKGAFATFTFNWNDKAKTLTISDRKGEFPGMLKERTFNVVFVGEDNGNNIDFAKNIAKAIHYNGKKAVVKF